MKSKYFSLPILLFTSFFLVSCNKDNKSYISGSAFGSIYHISINDIKDLDSLAIKSNIDFILKNIDNSASNYNPNSEISNFNNSNTNSYTIVSSNLYNIISEAKNASILTEGFFDITIGDIKIKKGFYVNTKKTSSRENNIFTYKDIQLSEDFSSIRKRNGLINVDLSGIAKGYAVDIIYNYLNSMNISDFVINIGGEIRTSSMNNTQKIYIDDPSKNSQYIEEIFLLNKSIASSGTYIDSVNYEGKEISHIINPKTLENISNLNILVSVIHNKCSIADALATGLLAMDANDIIKYSNMNNIASMLVIFDDSNIEKFYSENFIKFLSAD
ncbi:MAG: FAD:protein FMN transferase [Gammaproteobacteria bacterium]|jgi:FAD:protein FMN transferase|nr:FAD:protein FMN transferase [Gammaproteobacteria bacterium]MBT7522877.1 FAD:protein FMN transferase [Gammaproteobacteria bacterium]